VNVSAAGGPPRAETFLRTSSPAVVRGVAREMKDELGAGAREELVDR
jgi:hypothetical protein